VTDRILSAVAGIAVVVAGSLFTAGEVRAYERTQTCDSFGTYECREGETPKPISWPMRCVRYRINDRGSSDFGAGDELSQQLHQLVVDTFETWNDPSCSDFQSAAGEPASNSTVQYRDDAGFDGNMNLVVWRDERWPHEGGKLAFAITSVTYSSEYGTISDADIELNSAQYDFDDLEESQVGEDDPKVDLQNTLTHEVGHFLGLDHPEDIPDATMYGKARVGEIYKRELHRDDIDGLCAIYPASEPPTTCDQPEDFRPPTPLGDGNGESRGVCSTSEVHPSRGPIAAAWLAVFVLGLLNPRCGRGRSDADS